MVQKYIITEYDSDYGGCDIRNHYITTDKELADKFNTITGFASLPFQSENPPPKIYAVYNANLYIKEDFSLSQFPVNAHIRRHRSIYPPTINNGISDIIKRYSDNISSTGSYITLKEDSIESLKMKYEELKNEWAKIKWVNIESVFTSFYADTYYIKTNLRHFTSDKYISQNNGIIKHGEYMLNFNTSTIHRIIRPVVYSQPRCSG